MTQQSNIHHQPVMAAECLTWLDVQPDGLYVDATFGRGGHSGLILNDLVQGKLFAFDQDQAAIDYGLQYFKQKNLRLIHANFSSMNSHLAELGVMGQIDGILMDVGVSSPQLDEAARGFSFMRDGPLDMRMNQLEGETAYQFLMRIQESELERIIREYGEERFARRIARAIVQARNDHKLLNSTQSLVDVVIDAGIRRDGHKHPATRTFQAIRTYINHEIESLEKGLQSAVQSLKVGGRLVVISFQGLEHRVIKSFIRQYKIKDGELVIKQIGKAIPPSYGEVKRNPRARSAFIRVIERIK